MNTLPVLLLYTRNNRHTLLAVLRIFPAGMKIIAVDDASDDGSLDLLRTEEAAGRLTLLSRTGQPCRTAALNAGFAHARQHFPGKDVLRLHASTLPCPPEGKAPAEFVRHMAEALHGLPACGVLGVRLLCADGRILSEGRTTVSGLGLHSPYRDLRHLAPDNTAPLFGASPEVDSVRGDCVLYRSAALLAINALDMGNTPLDASYGPAGLEDDDLCFAARLCGFEVRVVPWLRAVHLGTAPPPEGANAPVLNQTFQQEKSLAEAQAEYWNLKWGWDPLLPDISELRRRYKHSRVCWNIDDAWAESDPHPAVDLCMVTWNGERVLRRCLESLAATDYPAHKLTLHIIDNASTDATPTILREFAAHCPFEVRVTRLDVNTGAVVGLNWAFTQGAHPLVAKLDDDIIVPSHWLKDMVDVFRARPYAGVVGPCIVDDTPERRVQCADFSFYPALFCHEGEAEDLQWAGLARVTHVRGCCNLYRRSVFARCGMLDIRYSPSQWDDPDHHMALLHAGYEVIYTGHVRVAHKYLTGTPLTPAAMANSAMNKAKMFAKWGTGSAELVECALLLSREGRFVRPDAAEFPECGTLVAPDPDRARLLCERFTTLFDESDFNRTDKNRILTGMAAQLRDSAAASLAAGKTSVALGELRTAVCCGAADPRLSQSLTALADLLEQLGVTAPLQRRLAATLQTAPPTTFAEAQAVFPSTPPTFNKNAPRCVRFRVPHSHRFDAPLRDLLDTYARALRAEGVAVELDCCAGGDLASASHITHLWTLDSPHETLSQLCYLRQTNETAVLTPLWRPTTHEVWAEHLLQHLLGGESGLATPVAPPTPQEGDAPLLRSMALGMAHVLPVSAAEARLLHLPEPQYILPLPPLPLSRGLPDAFCNEAGVKDFVLAVAPFHAAANQSTLLKALTNANLGLSVVLVGKAEDPRYLRACRRLAPTALFVDEMDDDLLASAFAAARLVALPSLGPCAHMATRAAITAWMLGKPVVATAESPESALPGVVACNPLDPNDVARALKRALLLSPNPQAHAEPARVLFKLYATLPGFA